MGALENFGAAFAAASFRNDTTLTAPRNVPRFFGHALGKPHIKRTFAFGTWCWICRAPGERGLSALGATKEDAYTVWSLLNGRPIW